MWRYCHCYVCKGLGPRLHSCIQCIFFGCYNGHIQDHAKANNHNLAIDLICGNIMCFQCGDYTYDDELKDIWNEYKEKSATSQCITSKSYSWWPSEEEIRLLNKNPSRRVIEPNNTIGLRGLWNLGNSCFMNSVVQVLMHTPVLRDYFFAEQHVCQMPEESLCIVCVVSEVFQQFYCGERKPLALQKLVQVVWANEESFISTQQQDVHEYFLVVLNILHQHFVERTSDDNGSQCTCFVDQIFAGVLQSDIVCQSCNSVSSTVEPVRAISLDIATCSVSKHTGSSGDNKESNTCLQNSARLTLLDCLKQYTRTEHLGSNDEEKIKCTTCKSNQESTIQTTIKSMPIVACFHLKRFKNFMKTAKTSICKKISTAVDFPAELDITPFLTGRESETLNPIVCNQCCRGHVILEDNWYSLFAIVNHIGPSLENGHYVAFIRQQQNLWFKCDDHKITPVSLDDVLSCEAYLLFYHKKYLEYK